MPVRTTRPKTKRLGARLLEAMAQIQADARGLPSGVARFTLPPNATPEQALAVMEKAMQEAEEQERAYLAEQLRVQIRTVRTATGADDGDLAAFLGVSVATVRAWEAGTKTPAGASKRLLAVRPRYWKKQLREALARETVN